MISTRWTSNLKEEDKLAFERKLKGARAVFKRLTSLTQELYDTSERHMQKRDFSEPAWSEKVAYELGYQKALKTILDLTKV